jgi:hypothetical protein
VQPRLRTTRLQGLSRRNVFWSQEIVRGFPGEAIVGMDWKRFANEGGKLRRRELEQVLPTEVLSHLLGQRGMYKIKSPCKVTRMLLSFVFSLGALRL